MIHEVVRRCPYCQREMKISAIAYAENPYCHACLDERVSKARRAPENEEVALVGRYFIFTQDPQKAA